MLTQHTASSTAVMLDMPGKPSCKQSQFVIQPAVSRPNLAFKSDQHCFEAYCRQPLLTSMGLSLSWGLPKGRPPLLSTSLCSSCSVVKPSSEAVSGLWRAPAICRSPQGPCTSETDVSDLQAAPASLQAVLSQD